MTDDNALTSNFLANHAAWFAAIADRTPPETTTTGISVNLLKDHGYLTVSADHPVPIEAIDRTLEWFRAQSARRLLVWSERESRDLDIVLSSRGCTAGFCPR